MANAGSASGLGTGSGNRASGDHYGLAHTAQVSPENPRHGPHKASIERRPASECKKWFKALPEPLDDLVDITSEMIRLKEAPRRFYHVQGIKR